MTKNNDVLFINPCIKKSSPGFPVYGLAKRGSVGTTGWVSFMENGSAMM